MWIAGISLIGQWSQFLLVWMLGSLVLVAALPGAVSTATREHRADHARGWTWIGTSLVVVGLVIHAVIELGTEAGLSIAGSPLDAILYRSVPGCLGAGLLMLAAAWHRPGSLQPLKDVLIVVGGVGLVTALLLDPRTLPLTPIWFWSVALAVVFVWIGVAAWSESGSDALPPRG